MGPQKITKTVQMVLSRVIESTDLTQADWLEVKLGQADWLKVKLHKGTMVPASASSPERVAPTPACLVLTLKLVSPHRSLVVFELLPLT